MIRSTQSPRGASAIKWKLKRASDISQGGFTLLEMCIVLFIIALLTGIMIPSIQSAMTEQSVRNDSRQMALMVRTAMLQSSEQHRPYVITLTAKSMELHPFGNAARDDNASTSDAAPEDVVVSRQLDSANKLVVPNPDKPNVWIAMPETSWIFRPGELCPATRIRLQRGTSWLELDFNALTGNVEKESTYFP